VVQIDDQGASGPVNGPGARLTTDPLYLALKLPAGADIVVPVTAGHNTFLYVYEGEAEVGPHPGSAKLQLTKVRVGASHPVLSPDGTKLAYLGGTPGKRCVQVLDL